jgi:hypothetical protein
MSARVQGVALGIAPSVWAATALIGVAGVVLTIVAWGDLAPADSYTTLVTPIAAIVYATLGAMVVRRAGNRIGWMLLGEGLGLAILCMTSAYAVVGLLTHPGLFPGARVVGTLSQWTFVPIIVGLAYTLLVFPTGALPSPRWRPLSTAAIGVTTLALVGFIVTPRLVALPAPGGVSLRFENPLAIRSLGHGMSTALIGTFQSLGVFSVLLLAAAIAALVVRFRSGGPELRHQIKWVAFAGVAAVVFQAVALMAQAVCGCDQPAVTVVAYFAMAGIALFGFPLAITIAILRHGLYQIDVIINRAVVYSLLGAALNAVYVVVVVGIGALADPGAARCSRSLHRPRSPCCSSRFDDRPSAWRTASCTGSEPRRTRSCPTSPRTWPERWGSTRCWTGWSRSSPTAPARLGSTSGSGWGPTCGRARSGPPAPRRLTRSRLAGEKRSLRSRESLGPSPCDKGMSYWARSR